MQLEGDAKPHITRAELSTLASGEGEADDQDGGGARELSP